MNKANIVEEYSKHCEKYDNRNDNIQEVNEKSEDSKKQIK